MRFILCLIFVIIAFSFPAYSKSYDCGIVKTLSSQVIAVDHLTRTYLEENGLEENQENLYNMSQRMILGLETLEETLKSSATQAESNLLEEDLLRIRIKFMSAILPVMKRSVAPQTSLSRLKEVIPIQQSMVSNFIDLLGTIEEKHCLELPSGSKSR